MSAANTDLFRKATPLFSTTLSASIGTGDTTIPLTITTRLPTDTAISLTIDASSPLGVLTPTAREVVTGVVVGTNLTNALRGQDGTTAQAHLSGAIVVDYDTAQVHNDMVSALLTSINQDGSLKPFSGSNIVGTSQLQANAVTSGKIAGGAVGSAQLASGAVADANISGVSALKFYNPYKFSYNLAATVAATSGQYKILFDTKEFDTGSNYSTSTFRFTAPVSGFYQLGSNVGNYIVADSGVAFGVQLYKNGTFFRFGSNPVNMYTGGPYNISTNGQWLIQATAGDYFEIYNNGLSGVSIAGGTITNFYGFLVSTT